MDLNLDIATTVQVILVFIGLGIVASLFYALQAFRAGNKLEFFRKRQVMFTNAWRLLALAILLGGGWYWVFRNAEPIAYQYFPPSPTSTRTPTITPTSTITPTLEWTLTPTMTETLQYTYTPDFPTEAQATIKTQVGPDSNSIFSPITFSTQLDANYVVKNTQDSFTAPVTHLYGGFSFDNMALGVQWTGVWLYEGKVICLETKAWTAASGGYGYTDCQLPADQWLPGEYEVQVFAGSTWKASGRFTIIGSVETSTPTPSPIESTPSITTSPAATQ